MTSAMSVSEMDDIYFLPPPTTEKEEKEKKKVNDKAMAMIFDLTLNVNKDADIGLDLEVIDGKLDCKTDGRFRLYYSSLQETLNLTGMLKVVYGRFSLSLKNFVPRTFDVEPGGSITFNGPLESASLNIRAKYNKQLSVKPLSSDINVGKTSVASYIDLKGNLMNPQPGFGFSFPDVTQDQARQLYTALDTTDSQSTLRQFFSVVYLNTFIASNSSSSQNLESQTLDVGIDMVTNMFNSYLAQQIKGVDIGVNVFSENESNYTEYSLNASIPLYNDRILVKTNIGYAQQIGDGANNISSFVGDVGVEILINENGNWRFKVFYANDQYEQIKEASRPTQRGGVALIFQQQFNSRKELVESWKQTKMRKREKKKKDSK